MHSFARARGGFLAATLLSAALAALWAPAGCARNAPCSLNSDCAESYCFQGHCKKDCVDAELDCPPGYSCSHTAQCVPGSTASTGSGGAASSSGVGGDGGAGASSSSSDSASSGPASSGTGGGMGGAKHELDLCGGDAECAAPLVCRPMVRGGAKRCASLCASSADCPSGTRCQSIDGTTYCAGDDIGRQCSAASSCNFACISSQQICTAECVTGSDCPNGYGCMGVGNPATRVCVKAEEPCAFNDPSSKCIVPAACDESLDMVVGGCTLICDTASDCPRRAAGLTSWTCDGSGICKRPAGVYGPLETGYTPAQYACNLQSSVVNVCNDGLHIDFDTFSIPGEPSVNCGSLMTTDGFPGDACVDSCRYQGGCPFGSACVAVGNVGNARIGLCLPTGNKEVGAACSSDKNCVFGYCNNGACSRDCTADGVCPTGSTCVAAGGPPVEGAAFKRCE